MGEVFSNAPDHKSKGLLLIRGSIRLTGNFMNELAMTDLVINFFVSNIYIKIKYIKLSNVIYILILQSLWFYHSIDFFLAISRSNIQNLVNHGLVPSRPSFQSYHRDPMLNNHKLDTFLRCKDTLPYPSCLIKNT